MATHVALLRAVNVGGNVLKMERLRALCEEAGFENVRTYVQSGNVVFASPETAASCCRHLENLLHGKTRLPVSVMVRSAAELRKVLAGNPFIKKKSVDWARLAVAFLSGSPNQEGLARLAAVKAGVDEYAVFGKHIFLHCPNGLGEAKLTNSAIEKALGLRSTARNLNTVGKLLEMAGG